MIQEKSVEIQRDINRVSIRKPAKVCKPSLFKYRCFIFNVNIVIKSTGRLYRISEVP